MTPTTIKWAVIAAVFLGWSWLCYHQGSLAPKLKAETAEVKGEQAQVAQESKQLTTNTAAETVHDAEVEHPTQLIIRQPVWLHEPAICPIVQVPAGAPGEPPAERPTDPGPGIDLRPQLAAFALKYENALSDCRRMASEWPK